MRASTVEYLAPARFDDLIEVFIRPARVGRTSITFENAAYRVDDDVLMVTAQQTLVLVDLEQRKACPIPESYVERLQRASRAPTSSSARAHERGRLPRRARGGRADPEPRRRRRRRPARGRGGDPERVPHLHAGRDRVHGGRPARARARGRRRRRRGAARPRHVRGSAGGRADRAPAPRQPTIGRSSNGSPPSSPRTASWAGTPRAFPGRTSADESLERGIIPRTSGVPRSRDKRRQGARRAAFQASIHRASGTGLTVAGRSPVWVLSAELTDRTHRPTRSASSLERGNFAKYRCLRAFFATRRVDRTGTHAYNECRGRGQQGCGAHPERGPGWDAAPTGRAGSRPSYEGVTRYESKTASTLRRELSSPRSDLTSPSSATYQFLAS